MSIRSPILSILPTWKNVLIVGIVCIVISSAESLVHDEILGSIQESATTCAFVGWSDDGEHHLVMNMHCDGDQSSSGVDTRVSDARILETYIKDPGPVLCAQFSSGKVKCLPQE